MKILYLDCCNSTNDELYKYALNSDNDIDAVTSKVQFAGKGTKGRSFESPANTGIYLSVLLKNIPNDQLLNITPSIGVLVRNSILKITGISTKIKPINDLYLNGKKVCGILCQANSSNGQNNFVIAGIGINLFPPTNGFSENVTNIAGYILDEYKEDIFNRLLVDVAESVYGLQHYVSDKHRIENLLEAYQDNLLSQDEIEIIQNNKNTYE